MTKKQVTAIESTQPDNMIRPDPAVLVPIWLDWFDREGRCLPWRQSKDPYAIWISEIMLQQTQVSTVIPYYERFLAQYPTVAALAGAAETDVLKLWEGLGYYVRARHLLNAAKQIVNTCQGRLPETPAALKALPGIGDYTAGAILSIARQIAIPAVDGNVVRVFSRLTGTPWVVADPKARQQVKTIVSAWLPPDRPGDFNEAVMDLGAMICLPNAPRCPVCPLTGQCVARQKSTQLLLPLKKPKRKRPNEQHTVIILHNLGRWHVVRRPQKGLLAGLYTFDWLDDAGGTELHNSDITARAAGLSWQRLQGHTHLFTHLVWHLEGYLIRLDGDVGSWLDDRLRAVGPGQWVTDTQLAALPFPTALEPFRRQALACSQAFQVSASCNSDATT